MRFDLTEDQKEIRATARGLLDDRSSPQSVREAAESGKGDAALWAEVSELGWPGIAIPEADGGLGLGMVDLCVLLEEQGAALAPVPLLPSVCAASVIARAASDQQRELWLPALAAGEKVGAIGMETSGTNGSWVAGGPEADVIVVLGRDGARLIDGAEAELETVETLDPLRSYGFTAAAGAPLVGDVARAGGEAKVAVAAELLGIARRTLEITVEFVKERKQFGVPVGSFQAVAHRCAEMLMAVEAARSAVLAAAWAADAAPEGLTEAAALAKLLASEAGVDVGAAGIQCHGGIGFTWEADIHWWYKRAQLDSQLLGGPSAQRRELGSLLAARPEMIAAAV